MGFPSDSFPERELITVMNEQECRRNVETKLCVNRKHHSAVVPYVTRIINISSSYLLLFPQRMDVCSASGECQTKACIIRNLPLVFSSQFGM